MRRWDLRIFELSARKLWERCSHAYYPLALNLFFSFPLCSVIPTPPFSRALCSPTCVLFSLNLIEEKWREIPQRRCIDESFLNAFKYLLKAIVHEIDLQANVRRNQYYRSGDNTLLSFVWRFCRSLVVLFFVLSDVEYIDKRSEI